MKYEITEKSKDNTIVKINSNMSFNELELLAEELECVKMWLNSKNVPTHDGNNNQYSVVGRIEIALSTN